MPVVLGAMLVSAGQPTTTTTPSTVTPATGSVSISGWVLLFGVGTLLLLYGFLFTWQQRTQALSLAALRRTGSLPTYEHVPAYIKSPFEAEAVEELPKKLAITGPATAIVGRPSEPFTVTLDDQPTAATWSTDWTRATLEPLEGRETRLTAVKEGPLQVKANVQGGQQPAVANVTVVAAPPTPGSVPFVGSGYGGLTVAILAVTIAGALTAQGILPSAALATLLGTVVSYFFVQRRAGQDSGGQAAAETSVEPGRPGQAE
jgi:hypothetical protein